MMRSCLLSSIAILASLLPGSIFAVETHPSDGIQPATHDILQIFDGGGGSGCGIHGQSCFDGEECCSADCLYEQCTEGDSGCTIDGGDCIHNDHCCNLICVGDICVEECLFHGHEEDCDDDGDCCSGDCLYDSCTEGADGCTIYGGDCDEDGSCCNGNCDDSTCVDACVPDCPWNSCGDDGCEGSCGVCGQGEICTSGVCECVPYCNGKECGSDQCGSVCGNCLATELCVFGTCECAPDCVGKDCGDDDCDGACGSCSAGTSCNGGVCEALCDVISVTGSGTYLWTNIFTGSYHYVRHSEDRPQYKLEDLGSALIVRWGTTKWLITVLDKMLAFGVSSGTPDTVATWEMLSDTGPITSDISSSCLQYASICDLIKIDSEAPGATKIFAGYYYCMSDGIGGCILYKRDLGSLYIQFYYDRWMMFGVQFPEPSLLLFGSGSAPDTVAVWEVLEQDGQFTATDISSQCAGGVIDDASYDNSGPFGRAIGSAEFANRDSVGGSDKSAENESKMFDSSSVVTIGVIGTALGFGVGAAVCVILKNRAKYARVRTVNLLRV